MPYLPFIMYAIATTAIFFLAGINYVRTDHLIERERIERLAGEHVALTMGLEAYRAENGAFPIGADWRDRIRIYSPGRHLAVEEGEWVYLTAGGGYTLCFATGFGNEDTVLNAPFLCPAAGGSGAGPGAGT